MPEFAIERWVLGERSKLESLDTEQVVVEFEDGSRIYVTAIKNGVKVRTVQSAMSYSLAVRPIAANYVRIELGKD